MASAYEPPHDRGPAIAGADGAGSVEHREVSRLGNAGCMPGWPHASDCPGGSHSAYWRGLMGEDHPLVRRNLDDRRTARNPARDQDLARAEAWPAGQDRRARAGAPE